MIYENRASKTAKLIPLNIWKATGCSWGLRLRADNPHKLAYGLFLLLRLGLPLVAGGCREGEKFVDSGTRGISLADISQVPGRRRGERTPRSLSLLNSDVICRWSLNLRGRGLPWDA